MLLRAFIAYVDFHVRIMISDKNMMKILHLPGLLVSMIAIDSDTVGDTFVVLLSAIAILLKYRYSYRLYFFLLYRYRLSPYFSTESLT
jgi:hypothetical protein